MDEPIWLSPQVVEILHLEQIAEHGGRAGVRDENALESALARPRHMFLYEEGSTLARLAAALCIGLAKAHPFVDGHKRVALLATYTFLSVNDVLLDADETETAEVIEGVAAGTVGEEALTSWIERHSRP